MAVQVVLDPAEVATNRTELDITPYVAAAGIDWGDGDMQAYMADQERGSSPVDFRIPNRQITVPLVLETAGTVSFTQIKSKMQAKTARFQAEGGWLKRVTQGGGTVFADIVNASFKLPDSWVGAHRDTEPDAQLTLEAIPDFYAAEITLSDHVETTLPELIFTETGIKGDYPGRVRIVVDEDDADDQLGMVWGFRSRNYSSATTAKLAYEAEALQALDTARILALAGASGGTAVTHGTITTNWTPIVGTNIGGTTFLTHTGTYRAMARLYSTSGTAVKARFVWDVGDLTLPEENPSWTFPGASNFFVADLGEVRLDPTTGTHRWQGQLQAKGSDGSENFSVDRLWFVPVDEGMGVLRAPIRVSDGLSTYSARDEFNQTAGVLSGKTLPIGGTWAKAAAGDADDWSVETAGKTAQRTATSDADINTGCYEVAGATSYTHVVVQADFKSSLFREPQRMGVLARYTDTSNYLFAGLSLDAAGQFQLVVLKRVTATVTTLASRVLGVVGDGISYSTRLYVDTSGRYQAWFWAAGGLPGDPLAGVDSVLATGGTLATGKPGIYDANTGTTAATRNADNFSVWVPPKDAVMFASQSAELGTNGMFREDSAGVAYGPVSEVEDALPRIPVSGLEGRTVEGFIKSSTGDLDQFPDTVIGDISARVFYRPSWLQVPES